MVIWDYNLKGYTHANHLTSVWQAGVGLCDVDHNEIFPCSPTPVLPTPPSPALDKQNWCFTYSSKTVLCNVLDIKEILNNFTTIFCAEIPCTYIFIPCTFHNTLVSFDLCKWISKLFEESVLQLLLYFLLNYFYCSYQHIVDLYW